MVVNRVQSEIKITEEKPDEVKGLEGSTDFIEAAEDVSIFIFSYL